MLKKFIMIQGIIMISYKILAYARAIATGYSLQEHNCSIYNGVHDLPRMIRLSLSPDLQVSYSISKYDADIVNNTHWL